MVSVVDCRDCADRPHRVNNVPVHNVLRWIAVALRVDTPISYLIMQLDHNSFGDSCCFFGCWYRRSPLCVSVWLFITELAPLSLSPSSR